VALSVVNSTASLPDLDRLHAALIEIAEQAGKVALRDFRAGQRTTAIVHAKDGGSPVTSADHAVDAYLAEALRQVAPIAFHSEERPASWQGVSRRGTAQEVAFVVDPIDGTRNFIGGGDAWCIVIGVISGGRPIAGAVHMPVLQETFSAFAGGGAHRNGVRLKPIPQFATPLRATGPRPVAEWLGNRLGETIAFAPPVPALAHRMLVPLTGHVDLALANGGGHDWDIVASDCILGEAGAQLLSIHGEAPDYRLDGGEHPPLIAGSRVLLQKIGASLLTDPA
jgi:myo-inositol-1(or 4)-monophosphatase